MTIEGRLPGEASMLILPPTRRELAAKSRGEVGDSPSVAGGASQREESRGASGSSTAWLPVVRICVGGDAHTQFAAALYRRTRACGHWAVPRARTARSASFQGPHLFGLPAPARLWRGIVHPLVGAQE